MVVLKNNVYDVVISDLNYEGVGIAKIEGFPIFVENALIGEKIQIKVIKVLKNYGIGIVEKFYTTSKYRVEIMDRKGTWTGTTPLQHLAYDQQLILKQKQVQKVMHTIAKLPDIKVNPTIAAPFTTKYRNKAQIPVRSVNNRLETGFFRKKTHQLIPMDDFIIQDNRIDEIIILVRDILQKYHIDGYNEEHHSGLIRHIVVRRGYYSGEVQVVLVAMNENVPSLDLIVKKIVAVAPDIKSVVLNINALQTNVILGKTTIVLFGSDVIVDQLLGYTFKISSLSFYQINPLQTEKLYEYAINLLQLKQSDIVLDAYCGIGTIGIIMAKYCKKVYGLEIVADAIEMAKENAVINSVSNIEFKAGDAKEILKEWETIPFDAIVVDPPRKGLDRQFIDLSLKVAPKKIVYISCNPATLARDLAIYNDDGYECEFVQPFDLFPHTAHVECVVLLTKVS